MKAILIVEDDITFGMMLKTWLGKKGFEVSSVSNIARARKHIESQTVDLVLSDLRLPDYEGIDLLKWMNDQGLDIPLIIMTGYADIQSAVLAMKLGARDYIAKPVNPEELLKKISEALQTERTPTAHSAAKMSSKKVSPASSKETTETRRAYLEGESDAAKQLYNYVGLVAPTNMSVLINGSSGTGKEYVAHRIHQLSKRSDKPFIAVDCGSIPKELAASEFFGQPTVALSFWMKSEISATRCRYNYSAPCKREKYVRSVLHKKYPWISAWYRPPTKIWNKESKREHFAKTFIIASMNLPCECLT